VSENRSSPAAEIVAEARDATVAFAAPRSADRDGVGRLAALRDVSLAIAAGEAVAVVGESGSGKTTLGRLFAGLVRPASGLVLAAPRSVGVVFQDPAASLNPRVPAADAVAEVAAVRERLSRGAARARALELLAQVGLDRACGDALPHELSGGQKQRAAIARALAARPRMLVCDEVLSALDAPVQAQVLELFLRLRERERLALLWITHDVSSARGIADRVAVMYAGRIVELGPAEPVLSCPAHPYTRALLEATPSLARRDAAPKPLPGEPPSPSALPAGCAFHPRCAAVLDRCRLEAPPRRRDGASEAECWLDRAQSAR
jgi:peptide/nickel transport system ATP-binding protein